MSPQFKKKFKIEIEPKVLCYIIKTRPRLGTDSLYSGILGVATKKVEDDYMSERLSSKKTDENSIRVKQLVGNNCRLDSANDSGCTLSKQEISMSHLDA